MEELLLRGEIVSPSGATADMDLVLMVSEHLGTRFGRGSFEVPAALVGDLDRGPLIFTSDQGDTITLLVTEEWAHTGSADFQTQGPIPAARRAA